MPLRLLGPLVVLFTLALLGSGLALIALGPERSRSALVTVLGHGIDTVMVHKVVFVAWAAVTAVHTLARLLPAILIVTTPLRAEPRVPGTLIRVAVVILTLLIAVIAASMLHGTATAWLTHGFLHDR